MKWDDTLNWTWGLAGDLQVQNSHNICTTLVISHKASRGSNEKYPKSRQSSLSFIQEEPLRALNQLSVPSVVALIAIK